MLHTLAFEPVGQIACNIRSAVVAEKPWPVRNGDVIKARCRQRLVKRGRDVGSAPIVIVIKSRRAARRSQWRPTKVRPGEAAAMLDPLGCPNRSWSIGDPHLLLGRGSPLLGTLFTPIAPSGKSRSIGNPIGGLFIVDRTPINLFSLSPTFALLANFVELLIGQMLNSDK